MFVRAVYATGDPALLDTAVRSLNSEGRDLLEERPGYRGAGVFADRELGKLLAVSWWESEETRRHSDEVMRERRGALLEPFAGTVAVANYEVAVLHQLRPPRQGGGLRITRMEFDPRDTDLVIDTFRATVLPRAESLPGLARASLLIDRERGRAMAGTLFVDRASLTASRAAVATARHEASAKAHVDVVGLEEFEVVYADVRFE
jgi:heme-degrading monooxygenase HmoA